MPENWPRGIAPSLLLSQVRNTMPYLFTPSPSPVTLARGLTQLPPAQVVRDLSAFALPPGETAGLGTVAAEPELTHFEYFRLCLSAHYLSCATPVPTDVDNQIRRKLWPANLALEQALPMAEWVLASREFEFPLLSDRFVYGAPGSAFEKVAISGHLGEWFTVACAAYAAMAHYRDPAAQGLRQKLYAAMQDEVARHAEVFGSLWRADDGLGSLRAAAIIAHNFGDLDRVMDLWSIDVGDPLRLASYKLTASPLDAERKLRYQGRLWVAGELYKAPIGGSSLAGENHRHFALRKPRALRSTPALWIPIGPFFDDWGKRVATLLHGNDLDEVSEALQLGWNRLLKSVGYGRALHAMIEVHPKLDIGKIDVTPELRQGLKLSQAAFERRWHDEALAHMEEIPSRA